MVRICTYFLLSSPTFIQRLHLITLYLDGLIGLDLGELLLKNEPEIRDLDLHPLSVEASVILTCALPKRSRII